MYVLQSMIIVRAPTKEVTRPFELLGTRRSPAKTRGALRINLDASRARRQSSAD